MWWIFIFSIIIVIALIVGAGFAISAMYDGFLLYFHGEKNLPHENLQKSEYLAAIRRNACSIPILIIYYFSIRYVNRNNVVGGEELNALAVTFLIAAALVIFFHIPSIFFLWYRYSKVEEEFRLKRTRRNEKQKVIALRHQFYEDLKKCGGNRVILALQSKKKEPEILNEIMNEVNINSQDECGKSALHFAVERNLIETIKALLKKGANLKVNGDRFGDTPIHTAVRHGHELAIRTIEKNRGWSEIGVYEAINKNKSTPLHLALEIGNDSTAAFLFRRTRLNCQDKVGNAPIHIAVKTNRSNLLQSILLEHDNDEKERYINLQNKEGNTALHLAVDQENKELIKLLLQSKVRLDILNNQSDTALHHSLKQRSDSITHLILSVTNKIYTKRCFLDIRDRHGNNPLHIAVANKNEEIIKALLDSGADVNTGDSHGRTILHMAIMKENNPLIALFLEHGADINGSDVDGKTPLIYALENEKPMIALFLISKFADINRSDKQKNSPLSLAVEKNMARVVQQLIKNCVQLNHQNHHGMTALMVALSRKNEELASFLIEAGAKVDLRSVHFESALSIAIDNNLTELALFLIRRGARLEGRKELFDFRNAIQKRQATVIRELLKYGYDVNSPNGHLLFKKCLELYPDSKREMAEIIEAFLDAGASYVEYFEEHDSILQNFVTTPKTLEAIIANQKNDQILQLQQDLDSLSQVNAQYIEQQRKLENTLARKENKRIMSETDRIVGIRNTHRLSPQKKPSQIVISKNDRKYGFIIAKVWEDFPKKGIQVFRDEVRNILQDQKTAANEYFSPGCIQAVDNANLLQLGLLPYGSRLENLSKATRFTQLYQNILAFHEHHERWESEFRLYQKNIHELYMQGQLHHEQHEHLKNTLSTLCGKTQPTLESFMSLWDKYPDDFSTLRG